MIIGSVRQAGTHTQTDRDTHAHTHTHTAAAAGERESMTDKIAAYKNRREKTNCERSYS